MRQGQIRRKRQVAVASLWRRRIKALMELGATVCVHRAAMPAFRRAPTATVPGIRRRSAMELPVKSAKKAVPMVRRKALVILRRHRGRMEVLLMQRPAGGLWEHMWEFPALAADVNDWTAALGVTVQTSGPAATSSIN